METKYSNFVIVCPNENVAYILANNLKDTLSTGLDFDPNLFKSHGKPYFAVKLNKVNRFHKAIKPADNNILIHKLADLIDTFNHAIDNYVNFDEIKVEIEGNVVKVLGHFYDWNNYCLSDFICKCCVIKTKYDMGIGDEVVIEIK
jgi:hypothetical protein